MKTVIDFGKRVFTLTIIFLLPSITKAQSKVEVSLGTDLVSSYIWRGTDCGGVSVQPDLSISYKGFNLGAWGSVGFDQNDTKELDLMLGYTNGGFSMLFTDYWFYPSDEASQIGYFKYSGHNTQHVFELTAGYDFGVMGITWNTNIGGADYYNADGKRSYSTYVALTAPFSLGGIDWNAEVGFTPWEGMYADRLNVTNISLKASKDIDITDSFKLPLFTQLVFNPYTEGAYFVLGLSL